MFSLACSTFSKPVQHFFPLPSMSSIILSIKVCCKKLHTILVRLMILYYVSSFLLFSGCMTSWKIWQWILWSGPATSEAISFWGLKITQTFASWNVWRPSASFCSSTVLVVLIFVLFSHYSCTSPLNISNILELTDIKALGFWSKL